MKFCAACNKTFADAETFCPNDGEVLQESPESIVGEVIDGKYKVEGFIAQGGMGAVYRARHILLGDQVVIKTLRSEMRTNAEWLKRFQREGKAARAFRHPNAVTVYDLSAGSDGMIYMVMEYVEGHTLDRELKRRGRFTPEQALEVLEPVADVLDSAHKRGVVHRDLKPENIMLGADDHGGTVVKVLDLGIAKMRWNDARHFSFGGECRIGEQAHQPDLAAAIDHLDPRSSQLGPELARGLPVSRLDRAGGAAIDAQRSDILHRPPPYDDLPPAAAEIATVVTEA